MQYSPEDLAYIQNAVQKSPSDKHLKYLASLVDQYATHEELFRYGLNFLPRLKHPATGIPDLERLHGYTPEIVEYFATISELPSLPESLKDVAIDFAVLANGNSAEVDNYYYSLDPENCLTTALKEVTT